MLQDVVDVAKYGQMRAQCLRLEAEKASMAAQIQQQQGDILQSQRRLEIELGRKQYAALNACASAAFGARHTCCCIPCNIVYSPQCHAHHMHGTAAMTLQKQ